MGKRGFICACLFLFILFIGVACFLYKKEINTVYTEVEPAFLQAISLDVNNRLKASKEPFFMAVTNEVPSSNTTIISGDTTQVVPKNEEVSSLGIEEAGIIALQTFLATRNPMRIHALDSLFDAELNKKGVNARTAVRYVNTVTHQADYTSADSAFYTSRYATGEVIANAQGSILLQGFVKFPASFILSRIWRQLVLTGTVCIVLAIALFLLIKYKRGGVVEITRIIPVKDIEVSHENTYIKMSEDVFFNPLKGEILYDNGGVLHLTELYSQLLLCFMESPGYFLSNEEMENRMRGGKTLKGGNWRAQTIRRLREILAPIPEITIENEHGKGYQLQFTDRLAP